MNEFSLVRYRSDMATAWDGVVRGSKNGNFLHLRKYLEYHAHRFQDESLLVHRNGTPVAVFPCNRVDDVVHSHSGITYAGLIYGHSLRAADILSLSQLLLEHFGKAGAKRLIYKPVPHIFHRFPAEEDLYALFRAKARLIRRDLSSAIYLPERTKLSDSRKNTIRKAHRAGVHMEEKVAPHRVHKLLTEVLQRHGAAPTHTLSELELLKTRFDAEIQMFGAVRDGRLLAGAVIYDFGHAVHSQYLAASEEGRQIGALDFLLNELIYARYHDRRYFSFGISTEDQGRTLNEGLVFQKEGFGARGVAHDFYEIDLAPTKLCEVSHETS